jgi:deoxyhypusine synthase
LENHYNRVTDTCIPEEEAFRRLQKHIYIRFGKMPRIKEERYFPHEYMYKMLLSGVLEQYYEIDPKNSWMLAAAQKEHSDCSAGLGRFHYGEYLSLLML